MAGFNQWLKRHARLFTGATIIVVSLSATALAIFSVRAFAPLERVDQFARDFEVAIFTPPEPIDPNIVVVAVKETTLEKFQYRSPVDRAFLAGVLEKVASGHPRSIGLDFLFDQPTEPAKDEQLRAVLRDLKAPLVVAYTDDPNIVSADQLKSLNSFVPEKLRGDAAIGEDAGDVARTVIGGMRSVDGQYIPGFARAIAAKAGVPSEDKEFPLVWHGRDSEQDAAFQEIQAEFVSLLPASLFSGKIVLIGSDLTLTDTHRTPFDVVEEHGRGLMPGVLILANAVSQIVEHRQSPDVGFVINLLITFGVALVGARLGAVNFSIPMRIGTSLLVVAGFVGTGILLFHYLYVQIALVAPSIAMALSLWASDSLTGLEERRQREFIHGAFSRYVSPKLVERLVKDPERMSLEGERRVMTYLFSDIESFTTMSEGLDSRELATVLNAYLEGVTRCVLKYDGMVDKFIGDSVFAIFNAPVDLADHAQCAVNCAIDMDRFAIEYSKEQKARGVPFGITRIGVHTGPAVIGNFGSSTRFNYTATGDSVNLASRLEGLNKHFHTRISVSQAAKDLCKNTEFRPIAEVVVKGKSEPIEVWQPLDAEMAGSDFVARYNAAYEALRAGDPQAAEMFTALAAERPDDTLVKLHCDRIAQGEHGVSIVMTEK